MTESDRYRNRNTSSRYGRSTREDRRAADRPDRPAKRPADPDETPEERRERIRRAKARREMRLKRKKRARAIRIAKLVLLLILIVAAVTVIAAVVRKLKSDQNAKEAMNAKPKFTEQNAVLPASDVLHLSFPVLTIATENTAGNTNGPLTVASFQSLLEKLYEANYVLVDIDDMKDGQVSLPEGKHPLIISEYNVNYDPEDTQHAICMVLDSHDYLTSEYLTPEGSIATNAMDVVPLTENFIAEHPDFSYNGARGIIAINGSKSVLGYDLAGDSEKTQNTTDIRIEGIKPAGGEEVASGSQTEAVVSESEASDPATADLKAVAAKLRENGWHIACSGFEPVSYASTADVISEDLDKWMSQVQPRVGSVDTLLMPQEGDFGPWSGYDENDDRYLLLKEKGFHCFFVEFTGTKTWAEVTDSYVRGGLHLIDTVDDFDRVMAMN